MQGFGRLAERNPHRLFFNLERSFWRFSKSGFPSAIIIISHEGITNEHWGAFLLFQNNVKQGFLLFHQLRHQPDPSGLPTADRGSHGYELNAVVSEKRTAAVSDSDPQKQTEKHSHVAEEGAHIHSSHRRPQYPGDLHPHNHPFHMEKLRILVHHDVSGRLRPQRCVPVHQGQVRLCLPVRRLNF